MRLRIATWVFAMPATIFVGTTALTVVQGLRQNGLWILGDFAAVAIVFGAPLLFFCWAFYETEWNGASRAGRVGRLLDARKASPAASVPASDEPHT